MVLEDSAYNLIYAVSALITAGSGIIVYALSRIHLNGKAADLEAKISNVATKLENTSNIVAQHEVQIKTGVKVAADISPDLQKALDDHQQAIDAATQTITQKTQDLNTLKATVTNSTGANPSA